MQYVVPTAQDACEGTVTVVCAPASGSLFPVGDNAVVCTAQDSSGNVNQCSFTIAVSEAAPVLKITQETGAIVVSWAVSCGSYALEETDGLGAAAQWAAAAGEMKMIDGAYRVVVSNHRATVYYRLRRMVPAQRVK